MERILLTSPTEIEDSKKNTEAFILALFMKCGDNAFFTNQKAIVDALDATFSEYRKQLAVMNQNPNISIRNQPAVSRALKEMSKNTYIIGKRKIRIRKVGGYYCNYLDKVLEDDFESIISDLNPFDCGYANVISKGLYSFRLKTTKIKKFIKYLSDRYSKEIYDIFTHENKVYIVFEESCSANIREKIRVLPYTINEHIIKKQIIEKNAKEISHTK